METNTSDDQQKKIRVDIIEAQSINLVDKHGTKRASLSCTGGSAGTGGFSVIHLYDNAGRPRISLQVDDRGDSSICLWTRENAPAVSMLVSREQGNGLTVTDSEGKPCIMMGVPGPDDPRGAIPDITVLDEAGDREWSVFGGECEITEDEEKTEDE